MNIQFPASRRTFGKVLGATLVATLGILGTAQAQTYPTKPITLVVPYPAGGANDMLGRLIGQKMSEKLGQQIIVENKPGAGTLIGATAVAKAPPDGYTLLVGGFASNSVSPLLFKADYDPIKDFEPIGMFGTAPTVVITYLDSPYKTIKDVVDAAKKKPGTLMYGSSGNGSPNHTTLGRIRPPHGHTGGSIVSTGSGISGAVAGVAASSAGGFGGASGSSAERSISMVSEKSAAGGASLSSAAACGRWYWVSWCSSPPSTCSKPRCRRWSARSRRPAARARRWGFIPPANSSVRHWAAYSAAGCSSMAVCRLCSLDAQVWLHSG